MKAIPIDKSEAINIPRVAFRELSSKSIDDYLAFHTYVFKGYHRMPINYQRECSSLAVVGELGMHKAKRIQIR